MSYDLQTEVDRIFRTIDRKVLFLSTDPFLPCPLTGNCRLLKSYADNILNWAEEYDHPNIPSVNGFHSWVRIIIKFGERVLIDAHDQGAYLAFSDPALIKSSVTLLSALELLFRLRVDLTIKSNARSDLSLLTSPYDCSTIEAISLQDQLIDDEFRERPVFQFSLKPDLTGKLEIEMKSHKGYLQELSSYIINFWVPSFVGPLLFFTSKVDTLKEVFEIFMTTTALIKSIPAPSQTSTTVLITSCGFDIDIDTSDAVPRDQEKVVAKIPVNVTMSKIRSRNFLLVASLVSDDFNCDLDKLSSCANVVQITLGSNPKFKDSLQTLLDVYIWLWSTSSRSFFGITPQHVTLMGKGLCGTLMVTLSCLLNNDRTANATTGLSSVPIPDQIITICSPFLLKMCESSSRMFGFLNLPEQFCDRKNNWVATTIQSLENYLDVRPKKKRHQFHSSSKFVSIVLYSLGKFSSNLGLIYEQFFPVSDCRYPTTIEDWSQVNDTWLKDISSRITQVNKVSSNGLISPLLHPRISKHPSISLHLFVDHFDVNLDDNISLAKLWSGPLKLHIIENESYRKSSWFSMNQCDEVIKKVSKILGSGE